jgi:ubiquinone/menaquinone biosynthesis C-methylase UbiE
MTRPRLTLKEAVDDVLDPAGKTIIDVGCGDGTIVRHLARRGATAIGIEVSEGQLERARKQAGEGEDYRVASGESLPFGDASAWAILFMKSFHHIPAGVMLATLEEAARVLEPGGQLIAIEPLAEGNYFEAMRPIEDETAVRAAAYAALQNAPASLLPEGEFFYESVVRFRDASHFIEAVIAPDPARRERLPNAEAELRRRYEALAQYDAEGAFFVAPMRRNTFRKAA